MHSVFFIIIVLVSYCHVKINFLHLMEKTYDKNIIAARVKFIPYRLEPQSNLLYFDKYTV